MSRYYWYCFAEAGLNHDSRPRFDTIEEALADILSNDACSPCCEETIAIFDLQKNDVVMTVLTLHDIESGHIKTIEEV